MNIKEIKEMINLMNENNLLEMEIEKDGMRIRLKKTSLGVEAVSSAVVYEHPKVAAPAGQQPGVSQQSPASAAKTVEIKAPMVGTFYRAPAPDAAPFVESGQMIEPGQVICILEAMKLMNEIKSEIKGKILEVLVDNAEPVEFGQPLFLIEPA